jgi:flagellar basal-body rod protein FlgG
MNQGTYPLAAAMINQINRVDMISNNLANANTTGFKQEGLSEGSFNNYLEKAQKENLEPTKTNTVLNTIPKIDTKYTNDTQGAIRATDNEFDFALTQKDTFFKVQNQQGEILLTRDGSFHSLDGQLVTGSGYFVLNENDDIIEIEEGFGLLVGVAKTNYENLDKIGNNTYRIKNDNEIENLLGNEDTVLQRSIERSNVNSVHTMVSLIDAHRRFAQSEKAIEAIGEMSAKLIEKLGRV